MTLRCMFVHVREGNIEGVLDKGVVANSHL